jgi:hypothetical protein
MYKQCNRWATVLTPSEFESPQLFHAPDKGAQNVRTTTKLIEILYENLITISCIKTILTFQYERGI